MEPNTANIATALNNYSHMLRSNNAENSSGSSSRNEYRIAPTSSKVMNNAEYYQYVMDSLSGNGRASSSTDISKPARYYNNNQMNSYDPFVEDSSGRSTGIENDYWGNNTLEVPFSVYQDDRISIMTEVQLISGRRQRRRSCGRRRRTLPICQLHGTFRCPMQRKWFNLN